MQVSIISTIYLAAFVQALIMMFVIIRKEKLLHSEKYLVGVLGALSVTLIHYVGFINKLIPMGSIFVDFSAIAWMTISPLLYLYSQSLIGYEYKWNWRNLIYFPFSIFIILQILLAIIGRPIPIHYLFDNWNSYSIVWILAYLINSLFFSILSINQLVKADLAVKHKEKLKWLIHYFQLFSFVLLGLIVMLVWWLNAEYFFYQLEYILLLFYALFIFSLVGMSLRFSHYFSMLSNDHYGHDKRDDQELLALSQRLSLHFEKEKPYLIPKLTLSDLSKTTGISENQLSQVFTRHLKSSFYNVINEYRLKEFERQLTQKGTKQYTIMALAECSGFASKATFYKVFKAHYQMTPSEFIKQQHHQ